MRRSTASSKASSAPTTSSRSSPRSRAKWFRVPAGMHTRGTSARMATDATNACEPSPPAMPMTSAPRSIAAWASSSRSSPGWSTTGSMPRSPALVGQPELLGLPAPGLQVHDEDALTGRADRRARHPERLQRVGVPPERVAAECSGSGQERHDDDQAQALPLGREHDGGDQDERGRLRRGKPRCGASPCGWRRPTPPPPPPAAAAARRRSRPTSPTSPTTATTSAVTASSSAPTAAARRLGSSGSAWLVVPGVVIDAPRGAPHVGS